MPNKRRKPKQLSFNVLNPIFFIQGSGLDVLNTVPGLEVTVGGCHGVVKRITANEIVCEPPDHYDTLTPEGHAIILVSREGEVTLGAFLCIV